MHEAGTGQTRRGFLRTAAVGAGGAVLAGLGARSVVARSDRPLARRAPDRGQPPAAGDPLAAMRAQLGTLPIQQTPLARNLVMLGGPGGNVVVLQGPDGLVVVDSFLQPAWPALQALFTTFAVPTVAWLIDTHWHFDHTDNNANFHAAGARVLAHENTKTRLGQSHDLLGVHFEPAPADALPTHTLGRTWTVRANGEAIAVSHIAPAHTDTDVSVHFPKANVLHLGDVYFNRSYPFIDAATGGTINGMIDGAAAAVKLCNARTKVIPGHGPLGDRASLTTYRDMLTTVRERVRTLKAAGRTVEQVQNAGVSAEWDATWGKGLVPPADFAALVYSTL